MRRSLIVLVAVLAVGYSLYGVLFLASGGIHGGLAADDSVSPAAVDDESLLDASDPVAAGNGSTRIQFAPAEAGVNYTFETDARGDMAMISNAGVYAGDYDSDGWTDLLAIGGERPVLYRNAEGQFEPSGALPRIERDVWGAAFVDYDVDGRPDIVLLAEDAPPLLLENVGGSFEKRAAFERPLTVGFGATVGDFDGDGCPDLFAYQYGNWTERLPAGSDNFSVAVNEDNGNPDVLYRGTCTGFERTEAPGIRGDRWTLAASAVDFDGDGRPDVHQANDMNHDVVYLNQGNGSFEQMVLPERTNRHAMSSEVADVTLDGRPDVFVTNIYYPPWAAEKIVPELERKTRGNNLVANHGKGEFVDRGEQYGLHEGGWGWAAVIADLDNDGDEDLFHTTRHLSFDRRDLLLTRDEQERLDDRPYYSHPVVRERADVTSFRRIHANASGFRPADGRGVARLDYDNDGDPDLVVATTDRFRVYENRQEGGNAVQVRVLGENGSQTRAYGATVSVTAGDTVQHRRVHARTDYNSQDSRLVHVGVGNHTHVDVTVTWPDGTERRFADVPTGQRVVVTPSGIDRRVSLDD